MKLKTSKFNRSWHFEASEDIMMKFKSQALHIIIIKYCNAGGSGNPPSIIPALWNIGILLHKQATRVLGLTRTKHFDGERIISLHIMSVKNLFRNGRNT